MEVKRDSNVLEDDDVLNSLLNSANYGTTLLEPQTVLDPKFVKELKLVYSEAFDESCPHNDAKDVANAFKNKLKQMLIDVNQYLASKREFPFLIILEELSEKLDRLSNKDYYYYLTNLSDYQNDLLDAKEDLLDPIKRFMNGDQANIYDSIRKVINGDTSNFDYIDGNELQILKDLLENPKPYTGNLIKDAKAAKDELGKKVLERIDEEKSKAISSIEHVIGDLKSKEEFNDLDKSKQNQIIKPFLEEIDKLQSQRYIAVIRDVKSKTLDILFPKQLNEMIKLSAPVSTGGNVVNEPTPHYIRSTTIKVKYPKSELRTEEDVNEYVEAFRKALLEQISNTKRISL